jgi:hypothetical protein
MVSVLHFREAMLVTKGTSAALNASCTAPAHKSAKPERILKAEGELTWAGADAERSRRGLAGG